MDKPESTHLGRGGEPTAIGAVVERVPLGEAVERWRQAREGEDSRTGGPGPAAAASGQRRGGEPPTVIRRRGRPRQVIQQDEDYQVLQAYMADFAREFNDRAPLKSSTTRLYNLLKRSGVSRDAFLDRLYAARAIVKERTGSIHGRGGTTPTGAPTKHTAAYFFAVLEDLLGLRTDEAGPTAPRRVG